MVRPLSVAERSVVVVTPLRSQWRTRRHARNRGRTVRGRSHRRSPVAGSATLSWSRSNQPGCWSSSTVIRRHRRSRLVLTLGLDRATVGQGGSTSSRSGRPIGRGDRRRGRGWGRRLADVVEQAASLDVGHLGADRGDRPVGQAPLRSGHRPVSVPPVAEHRRPRRHQVEIGRSWTSRGGSPSTGGRTSDGDNGSVSDPAAAEDGVPTSTSPVVARVRRVPDLGLVLVEPLDVEPDGRDVGQRRGRIGSTGDSVVVAARPGRSRRRCRPRGTARRCRCPMTRWRWRRRVRWAMACLDAVHRGADPLPCRPARSRRSVSGRRGHGSITLRRGARPRCRSDFTVPGRTPSRSAMSASERSS